MNGACPLFPGLSLPGLHGAPRPLSAAWEQGPALVLVGHSGCDTTRYCLPHLARLTRERQAGQVVVVMQDDLAGAREALARTAVGEHELDIRLDGAPYALGEALALRTVPTTYLVAPGGPVEVMSEGFRKEDFERFARALGAPEPFFAPGVKVSKLRPG